MKVCNICGRTTCLCDYKRFIAKVDFLFEAKTEKECNKKLQKFYDGLKKADLKGYSRATYPGACHKNGYGADVYKQIVEKFAKLVISYGYDQEQISKLIDGLMDDVEAEVSQQREDLEADMAYERMKEEKIIG